MPDSKNYDMNSQSVCNFEERGFLKRLGVYGFEPVEKVILAALITMDPLLLIGRSGTGKTFLLNSISEALGLIHRHYNASLISFDDLVGFPYPDETKTSIRYMETPATIWKAESVLVDEISRCKPEHQNRLFSLVHERRIQGMPLENLIYRWAAMNPCIVDEDDSSDYLGSEALDQALADRFGLIIEVGDWENLSTEDQRLVANPAGDGELSADHGQLKYWLEQARLRFTELLEEFRPVIKVIEQGKTTVNVIPHQHARMIEYVIATMKALLDAGIRMSPRRSRMLMRNLLAAHILDNEQLISETFKQILTCSIPHLAWGVIIDPAKIHAAHRFAWDLSCKNGKDLWLHSFLMEGDLTKQIKMLYQEAPSPDSATMAVNQFLNSTTRDAAAIFAVALYPAAAMGKTPLSAEGVNDLGKVAQRVLSVDGNVSWQAAINSSENHHPEYTRYGEVTAKLDGKRKERAEQFLKWAILEGVVFKNPENAEKALNDCIMTVKQEAGL
jgi:MoxR-like ATPase